MQNFFSKNFEILFARCRYRKPYKRSIVGIVLQLRIDLCKKLVDLMESKRVMPIRSFEMNDFEISRFSKIRILISKRLADP